MNKLRYIHQTLWGGGNNLIANGSFEAGIDGWTASHRNYIKVAQSSLGVYHTGLDVTITTPYSGNSNSSANYSIDMIEGHIYYGRAFCRGFSSNYAGMNPRLAFFDVVNWKYINSGTPADSTSIEWQKISAYGTSTSTGSNKVELLQLIGTSAGDITAGMRILYDEVAVYDLTEMFGAGNEPTKKWCDENL